MVNKVYNEIDQLVNNLEGGLFGKKRTNKANERKDY